ncbi:MAG: zf-HC2 domain-containing protein [Frankiaceae bacterium]
MTVTTCAHVRLALGVYVLGSIDPADRPAVEEHLAQCPSCRDELASLAGIPGLLGRLEEPEVVALADPPDSDGQLLSRILRAAAAAHRRSRRRRVLLSAAALVLLLTGIGAGAKVLTSRDNTSAPATVSLTSTAGPLSVRAGLTARAWGTSVDLRLSGVPGGYRCRVVAVSRDGGTDTAASYTSTYAGSMLVSGATALQLAEITELRIIDTSGRTLVSMPR